ncbi:MAG: peptide deformylase [Legionella sp.]|nr:MAG: peptide deformylase [Legionella sp.]
MKKLLDKDDPILRQIAEPISQSEFGSEWLKELIKDMFSVMENKGAVGVAAPQIGISKRVIVFSSLYTKRRKIEVAIPDTALINPSFKILSEEKQTGYEGCLNVEETMGEVPRAMDIEYSGFDIEGNLICKQATGLEARILQHEIDHLDGFLFLDRIENKDSLTTMTALQNKV